MISIDTLIKHLSAPPWALIPQHMSVREDRRRATVDLWEPKHWQRFSLVNLLELRPNNWFQGPCGPKLVKNTLRAHVFQAVVILSCDYNEGPLFLSSADCLEIKQPNNTRLSWTSRACQRKSQCDDQLPSQTMVGLFHSPSAPHTDLPSPLLLSKPSSQSNVATLPNVVPVTDSSTVPSTEAGWPQSTTEWDKKITFSSFLPHKHFMSESSSSLIQIPLQEARSLWGWNGSSPLWTLYPSWQLQSKLPSRFLHWPPCPHKPATLHSSMSAQWQVS